MVPELQLLFRSVLRQTGLRLSCPRQNRRHPLPCLLCRPRAFPTASRRSSRPAHRFASLIFAGACERSFPASSLAVFALFDAYRMWNGIDQPIKTPSRYTGDKGRKLQLLHFNLVAYNLIRVYRYHITLGPRIRWLNFAGDNAFPALPITPKSECFVQEDANFWRFCSEKWRLAVLPMPFVPR